MSASGVLLGKWLGSLLPLAVEWLLVGVVLVVVTACAGLTWQRSACILLLLGGGVLWAGLWGMFCAVTTASATEGLRRGTWMANLFVFIVPTLALVAGHLAASSDYRQTVSMADAYYPALVGPWLLYATNSDSVLRVVEGTCGLGFVVATVLCLQSIWILRRRLQ